jgi:hypothetical protein
MATRKKRGRPPGSSKKKEGDKKVALTLSQHQHDYLLWLTDHSHLGYSVELILHKLIADALEEMNPSNLQPASSQPPTPAGPQDPSQTGSGPLPDDDEG